MGRGRGKGKRQTTVATRDDRGSGEEEKVPAHRRRGRPQKPLTDEFETNGHVDKVQEGDETAKSSTPSRNGHDQTDLDNEMKRRKRSSTQVKENSDAVHNENGVDVKTLTEDSVKPVGFRQIGSRRKSKPRRAAEVGVEC